MSIMRRASSRAIYICMFFLAVQSQAAIFSVINTNDSGAGSLRAAVTSAITGVPPHTINFSIPGSGPHTIVFLSSFPYISTPGVSILADTQPGYTLTNPVIRLIPTPGMAAQTSSVFALNSSSTIRGFHISGFTNVAAVSLGGSSNLVAGNIFISNNVGVYVSGGIGNVIGGTNVADRNVMSYGTDFGVRFGTGPSTNTLIAGNFLGTSIDGKAAWPNRLNGIFGVLARSIIIRGTTNALQLISGNGTSGISLGNNVEGTIIAGNYIGVNITGTQQLANAQQGIDLSLSSGVTIGGTNIADRNIISGNQGVGVQMGFNSRSNVVMNNYIGLNVSGSSAISNNSGGVQIFLSHYNTIGGINRGNYISGNDGGGIFINENSSNNVIVGNVIGMTVQSNAAPNIYPGISLYNSSSNRIGGTIPGEGNVIVYCPTDGIYLADSNCTGNIIQQNYIGVDKAGVKRGNTGNGIHIDGGVSNRIGDTFASGANIISGNIGSGVLLINGARDNILLGNYIGVNPNGTIPLTNDFGGVRLIDSPNNRIGAPLGGNLIAGNKYAGISIEGTSSNTIIEGNTLGTFTIGALTITNIGQGIQVFSPGVRIGGTNTDQRNIISGSSINGININPGADNAVIQGNYIGLNADGTAGVSNQEFGIIINSANNTLIGGAGPARNVISGSRVSGIYVTGSSSNTAIKGNYIGSSANGASVIRNNSGIDINADYVTIGGTNAQEGNLIVGHQGTWGINVTTGRNIRIVGNVIGLASNGVSELPNGFGIHLQNQARNVVIGGTNANERNVIARNDYDEILVEGPSGGHSILGNFIGVRDFGVAFGTLNSGEGIRLMNSSSNQVLRNVIGQVYRGLLLQGTGTFANVVQGNFIGEYNLEPLGNLIWGVVVEDASDNRIGGDVISTRNLIAQNGGGMLVTNTIGSQAINNLLAANTIYSNSPGLNIDLGGNGFNANDLLDPDNGPNRLQNRPVLTNGITASGIVYAQGVLTSAPLSSFGVDIYRSGSTNAEGQLYLGRVIAYTDGSGVGKFSAGFSINLAAGVYLAATATDPNNNTSEFAASPTGLISIPPGDTDADGIPNYWETFYGLNPAVSNAPDADFDSDGYPDLSEYIADTPANDAAKMPVITDINNTTNRLVSFPSSNLRVYSLFYNDQLAANPLWTQVGGSVTGQFGYTTMTDAALPDFRAYRMSVRLP